MGAGSSNAPSETSLVAVTRRTQPNRTHSPETQLRIMWSNRRSTQQTRMRSVDVDAHCEMEGSRWARTRAFQSVFIFAILDSGLPSMDGARRYFVLFAVRCPGRGRMDANMKRSHLFRRHRTRREQIITNNYHSNGVVAAAAVFRAQRHTRSSQCCFITWVSHIFFLFILWHCGASPGCAL